jgi:uncharacterized protein
MLLDARPPAGGSLPRAAVMSAAGGLIGFTSSLTATGGASLTVPFLVRHNITLHQAIGTAAAVGWPLALVGTLGYLVAGAGKPGLPDWSAGFIYAPAVAWIVLASMAMAPVCARVAHHTPGKTLKRVFAIVLYLLATNMLVRYF